MYKFPFSFENLKYFCAFGFFQLNDAFCEFIGNMQHLKTLNLRKCGMFSSESLIKILELPNVSSNVVEMEIQFYKSISSEPILRFLKQSHNLKKIGFLSEVESFWYDFDVYSNVMQNVLSNLEKEWTSYVITPNKNIYNF